MPNSKVANPGVPPGTEIVALASPWGGWVSNPTGTDSSRGIYLSALEGIEAGLTGKVQNQYTESNGVTLFRMGKHGHIAPGKIYTAMTDAGGVTPHINQLPINGATGASSDVWVVLANGRVVRFSISITVDKHDVTYGHVAGADHTGHTVVSTSDVDIITMYDLATTPVRYGFWSWEDNTDADVGYINLSTPAIFLDNWFSSLNANIALKKGVPHKICKGPDANIYILNGNLVEQIVVNGALASATKGNELNLGTGWVATGIVSYKNYVAITASSTNTGFTRGESALFLWNGLTTTVNGVTSTAPQFIFPIQDNFVNGLNYDGNIVYVFTNGRNNTSKIWEFTGKGFKRMFETPLLQMSTTPVGGGIENIQDSMLIGSIKYPVASNTYAHIFRFFGGGFHDEGVLTDGPTSATAVGMVKSFSSTSLFVGVDLNGIYSIYFDTNTPGTYLPGVSLKTILYTSGILGRRMYPLGFKGTVNRIQIYLSQWGTGASLTLSLFKDYTMASVGGAGDLLNLLIDTDTSTPNSITHKAFPVGTTEIDISDIAIPNLSAFYMVITWSHTSATNTAAIIRRLITYWAPSQ